MTEKEQLVYDCIKANDDGIGVPAKTYYYCYLGEQLEKGEECTIKEKEFIEIVESLCEQDYLEKKVSYAGGTIYTLKKAAVPAQGNFFASVLEKFSNADEQTIMNTAESALSDFVANSHMSASERVFQAMILAANVGLGGTHTLTDKQKSFIDFIFSKIYKGDMERIYSMLATDIKESSYQMLELFCNLGKQFVGMPLLYYILSFAYIDGTLNPIVAERLEQIFSTVLLLQFFSQDDE